MNEIVKPSETTKLIIETKGFRPEAYTHLLSFASLFIFPRFLVFEGGHICLVAGGQYFQSLFPLPPTNTHQLPQEI